MEDGIFAMTHTLVAAQNATMLDIVPLFTNYRFRQKLLSRANITDRTVLEFWQEFNELSPAAQREFVAPILRRMRALYRSEAVRNILCQQESIDFSDILNSSKILLLGTAGKAISAEANLLGEILISKYHLAAQARLDQESKQYPLFLLGIDEAHHYQGGSLPLLMKECRKMGVSLLLISQHLNSWNDNIMETILGNLGNAFIFRIGTTDARRLHSFLAPFPPEYLENQDRYRCVVKMHVNGALQPAFAMATIPVEANYSEDVFQEIRTRSLEALTQPKATVEAALQQEVEEKSVRSEPEEPASVPRPGRPPAWDGWDDVDEE